jgi:hypothetical protein
VKSIILTLDLEGIVEKKGVIMASLVVFPILIVLFNFQLEQQMDAIVKTTASDIRIVNDQMDTDIQMEAWARDFVIYHVTKQVMEKLNGYTARFVGYDYESNIIKIEIYGNLTSGSDTACQEASYLFHSLTNNLVEAQLEVTGDWVPSRKNPMDREWTQYLIQKISY